MTEGDLDDNDEGTDGGNKEAASAWCDITYKFIWSEGEGERWRWEMGGRSLGAPFLSARATLDTYDCRSIKR